VSWLPRHSALLTDLYELTMAAAYCEDNFSAGASFELFVRCLPPQRTFLLAAGLEQALDYLEALRFQPEEIDYLRCQPVFAQVGGGFWERLRDLRFSGEVWAIPEGTPVFGEEPILRVTAPIIEAQVVETFLLATITFQTMIASKAARVVAAASGRDVIEFGTRRAHGPEAGLLAARAAFIGGCAGTSNVEAGRSFDIPTFGTLAHSYVMAYDDELEAFRRFERLYPEHAVLLVDTYDTLSAVDKIIHSGLRPKSIRLDSGDLCQLSKEARRRLDAAGLQETQIFATGDLDEFAIAELLASGATLDAFGVGTALSTSKDAPSLGGVYKLVDVAAGGAASYRAKFSEDKFTYPGRKQVFRFSRAGTYTGDLVACASELYPEATPLLTCAMRNGRRIAPSPDLPQVQQHAREELAKLPEACRRLHHVQPYSVRFSSRLRALLQEAFERANMSVGRPAG
jgi:nicotinate phosphoribosyltransferase